MTARDIAPLEALLSEWAQWMSHEKVGRGYPSRVPIFSSGGSSESFEDLCERADAQRARTVDAVIRSLPTGACAAVHSVWLGSKWVLDWMDRAECYAQAVERLPVELNRRGVVY